MFDSNPGAYPLYWMSPCSGAPASDADSPVASRPSSAYWHTVGSVSPRVRSRAEPSLDDLFSDLDTIVDDVDPIFVAGPTRFPGVRDCGSQLVVDLGPGDWPCVDECADLVSLGG